MINFATFLTEAAGKALSSNTGGIKTKGHIKRYIFPYLSSEQKKQSMYDLGGYFSDKDVKESDQENHGKLHNPEANFTHTLVSSHNQHAKGTNVKINGVYKNGSTIMARTAEHGDMPISKLGTPEELAAGQKTKKGFELEHILQNNTDPTRKPAGATKTAYDFSAGDLNDTNKSVRGKAVKSDETPFFRGESKASKKGTVAMGTSELKYDPEAKQWKITNPQLSNIFSKATVKGVPLLDHLNKNHSDGVIGKGFTADAHPGTAIEYLRSTNANALHLHRYAENKKGEPILDHGTTYTVGDNNYFKGRLGIGHLSEDDLLKFDGKLNIEKSRPGNNGSATATVKHRPPPATFKSAADASINNPEEHMSLHNSEHGAKFRENFARTLQDFDKMGLRPSLTGSAFKTPVTDNTNNVKPKPMEIATQRIAKTNQAKQQFMDDGGGQAIGNKKKDYTSSNEMFGKPFHGSDE